MAGRYTISKGETFSGLEKRYNLPYIQPAPKRLPVDLIKFSQAIAHAETGGERNPYIRTRFGNSTAYGPHQMTGTLIRDAYNRYPELRATYGKFIQNKLLPMYDKFKTYGREPNKPGYDKRFDYGGLGYQLTDDEKLQLNDIANFIMNKNFERARKAGNITRDTLLKAGIQRWRGVPYEQDPQYYNKVISAYNGKQTLKKSL